MPLKFKNALRASQDSRTVYIKTEVWHALGNPEILSIKVQSGGPVFLWAGDAGLKVSLRERSAEARVFSRSLANLINTWRGATLTTIRQSKQGIPIAIVKQDTSQEIAQDLEETKPTSRQKPYWWRDVYPDFALDKLYHGMAGITIDELCLILGKWNQPLVYEDLKTFLKNPKFELPNWLLHSRFSGPAKTIGRRIVGEEFCLYFFTKRGWNHLLDTCWQHKTLTLNVEELSAQHGINYFSMTIAIADARYYIETGKLAAYKPGETLKDASSTP